MPVRPEDSMLGIAGPDELFDLWEHSGTAFDVRFLQLRIHHHQGGVEMTAHASTHAGLDPVRQAAAGMRMEQAEEIVRMRAVITSYGVGA